VRLIGWLRGPLLLVLALHLHLHHHFRGSPVGYVGLAAGSAASWIGVPGPGEPLLIAAGILAARHHLDIASVLVVAWLGATAGGVAGWVIGIKAGRTLLTAPGPLVRLRRAAVARGDEIFGRFGVVAILLTPSWIAGIHRVRTSLYLPTNAAGAAVWAAGIGLGAYYLGADIAEVVGDMGWVLTGALVLLLLVALLTGLMARRRRRQRSRALRETSG
jgi:membrane protein DedA with SNARE-associated domain